jgi:RND family efflux transporter MFP subunit
MRVARVARDYATITAPFDGVVSGRLADPGTLAAPGVPLMKVQGGAMRLEAVIPESALAAARIGSHSLVKLDALGRRELAGRVVEVSPQGDPSSHTFLVKVDLPPDSGVRPGMFGRARFRTGLQRGLQVPASAVLQREGLDYVLVVDAESIARLRLITIGHGESGSVNVLSGLRDGERVIVRGSERVADGLQVREQ